MGDTNEVCKFLAKRGVEKEVIFKIQEEKMDERAISVASDENLRQLGIVAQGDILALRAFATGQLNKTPSADRKEDQEDSREQRKKMLIEKLVLGRKKVSGRDSGSSKEKKAKVMEAPLPRVKTRKVKLAWQHFNQETERYVMVRESTGGGQREMSISVSADYTEILNLLIDLFFPNGKSSRGSSYEMEFCLGNFSCEVVSEDGFTLGNYISTNKLSKPRLYLLSKSKADPTDAKSNDGKDDLNLYQSASTPKQNDQLVHLQAAAGKDHENEVMQEIVYDPDDSEVLLKGFASIDDSFCPFLLDDTIVDLDVDGNQCTSVNHEHVEEPAVAKCEICLDQIKELPGAHPVGCLDMFHEDCLREWQKTADPNGSIKCPVCRNDFKDIVTVPAKTAPQCSSYQRDVLLPMPSSMNPSGASVKTSPTVLHGRSSESDESDEDLHQEAQTKTPAPDVSRDQLGYRFRQNSLPQLLRAHHQERDKTKEKEKTMQKRRIEAFSSLCDQGDSKSVTINRENIAQDMLNLYSDNSIVMSLLNVTFIKEPAMDLNGVKREAFTLFWEKVMSLYFEGTTTYVPRISPAIDESIYKTLGRIMSHGYVMVGVFPALLSKTFFTALVAGKENVTDNDFLEGFLDYVSSYDNVRLQNILGECSTQQSLSASSIDFLVDFLSEFNVSKMPNAKNLQSILVSVAKTELWNKAVMAANSLKEGLFEGLPGNVWHSATKDQVDDLYQSLQVTTDKVLSLIAIDDPSAMTKGQHTVFTYFKKYVRTLNERELSCFLRYVTGSSAVVVPSIKVIFHSHIGNLPHVTVHACSAVVDLPSGGYNSFADFKSQMDEVLKNEESWKFSLV